MCDTDSTLCPSRRRPLKYSSFRRTGQVLRYSIFAEGSTDVIVHFDVDGVESTQRTLKCDCTLLPKVGSFLVRRAGRLHFTIENDNLIRSKIVQYKVGVVGHPDNCFERDECTAISLSCGTTSCFSIFHL